MALKMKWIAVGLTVMALMLLTTNQALAGKWTKTFKNKSAVAANDFHFKKGNKKIKTASAKKVGPPDEKAFPDKAFDPPVDEFDWTTAENLKEIPAEGKMKVTSTGTWAHTKDSYFTRDGVKLETKCVRTTVSINPTGNGLQGTVSFGNDTLTESVILGSVEVRVDNTADPDQVGEFIPDGTLVGGIPSSFTLNPGETRSFPYTATDASLAISISDYVALASAPDDQYWELTAERPPAIIPTLTEWGMIIFGVVLLGFITWVFLKRRKVIGVRV